MSDQRIDSAICQEIHELVSAIFEGELSADRQERLDDLICSSSAVRQYYLSYIQVNLDLNLWASGPPAEFSELDLAQDIISPADSPTLGFLGKAMKGFGNFVVTPANLSVITSVLVIGTCLVVLGQIYFNSKQPDDSAVVEEESTVKMAAVIAKVTKTHRCVWGNGSARKRLGSSVFSGETLTLENGWADITFANQVVVRLEKGTQICLENEMLTQLKTGRLTAYVPPGAEGFTVATNAAKIVDLGTEFGVHVTKKFTSNVYVFKGKVEVSPTAEDRSPADTKILRAGESISINTAGKLGKSPVVAEQFNRPQYRLPVGPLLYADDFNSDLDIEFGQRFVGGKGITGSIAKRSLDFFKTAGNCRLLEFTSASHRGLLCLGKGATFSPEYNFNTKQIESAGGIVIELDLSLTGDHVDRELHWFGIRLLASSEAERIGNWGHLKGVHFHIRGSGVYSLHDAGQRFNAMDHRPRFTPHSDLRWHRLRIEIRTKKFDGKTPARIVAYANGSSKPFLDYKTRTGFRDNFIALDYENASAAVSRSGLVDRLSISLLKEENPKE